MGQKRKEQGRFQGRAEQMILCGPTFSSPGYLWRYFFPKREASENFLGAPGKFTWALRKALGILTSSARPCFLFKDIYLNINSKAYILDVLKKMSFSPPPRCSKQYHLVFVYV